MKEETFRLVSTLEFDLTLAEEVFPTRVEIFHSTRSIPTYRARIWQVEGYRIQPIFPQDEKTGEPLNEASDEDILIERTWYVDRDFSAFEAQSVEDAEKQVLDALDRFFNKAQGNEN